jgi:uncharacterized protein YdhG (YjbR/CyaY superfamily)
MNKYTTIDEYIVQFPEPVKAKLQKIRELIHDLVPEATETISYAIPTFDLHGKHLIHFAGFKNHISFFPTASGVENFIEELKDYKTGPGTIQFPLEQEIPWELIKRIVKFRVDELLMKIKK